MQNIFISVILLILIYLTVYDYNRFHENFECSCKNQFRSKSLLPTYGLTGC